MKTYYVYILECDVKIFYMRTTSNFTERFESYKSGTYKDSYTSKRKLVYYFEFTNPNTAIEKFK